MNEMKLLGSCLWSKETAPNAAESHGARGENENGLDNPWIYVILTAEINHGGWFNKVKQKEKEKRNDSK